MKQLVKVYHPDFEYFYKGEPTGEYPVAEVLKRQGNKSRVNIWGKDYWVENKYLKPDDRRSYE